MSGNEDNLMQLPLFEGSTPTRSRQPQTQPRKAQAVSVGRHSSIRNPWITPRTIIDRAIGVLGAIDLDPCSTVEPPTNVPARRRLAPDEDSLKMAWQGRVWLNPPYGRPLSAWIEKLCNEYETGDVTAAIALLPVRTDQSWWQSLANYPYCALRERVKFIRVEGDKRRNPVYPSAVVYFGPQLASFAGVFGGMGIVYIPYNG